MPVDRLLVAGALTLLAAASAVAAASTEGTQSRPLPVEVLPWSDEAQSVTPRDDLDLPLTNLRAGSGWWALACQQVCSLQPLKLAAAKSAQVKLQYNGDTPGQHLRFAPAPPRGTVLLFHPLRPVFARHPLKAGPVPSAHAVGDPSRTNAGGAAGDAREILVDRPDGDPWLLSPTLLRPAGADDAQSSNDNAGWPVSLDLRLGRHRQSLGIISNCGEIAASSYLLWAGDLDGDGRTDFVVQFDLAFGGEIGLWLSSLAGPGQFVGEAGQSTLMFEGEC